jgi:hypothetical protein
MDLQEACQGVCYDNDRQGRRSAGATTLEAVGTAGNAAPALTIPEAGCPLMVQSPCDGSDGWWWARERVRGSPSGRNNFLPAAAYLEPFLDFRQERLQVVRKRRRKVQVVAGVIREGNRLSVQEQAVQSCRLRRLVGLLVPVAFVDYKRMSLVLRMHPDLVRPAGQRLALHQAEFAVPAGQTKTRRGALAFIAHDHVPLAALPVLHKEWRLDQDFSQLPVTSDEC